MFRFEAEKEMKTYNEEYNLMNNTKILSDCKVYQVMKETD